MNRLKVLRFNKLEFFKFNHNTVVVRHVSSHELLVFDPYKVEVTGLLQLGYVSTIFISHDHFDHFSAKDISLVAQVDTKFVIPSSIKRTFMDRISAKESNISFVDPLKKYTLKDGFSFIVFPAYNTNKFIAGSNKLYHEKDSLYCGFLAEFYGTSFYYAGDTDIIPEMKILKGKVDVAFLPVSGKYVMDIDEALQSLNIIAPKIVVPMHYGEIIGDKNDAIHFSSAVNKMYNQSIKVAIL